MAMNYNYPLPVWYWILMICIAVFTIVIRWIVYRKAGEHGWACIIPFYADYCLCRMSGKPKLFLPLLVTSIGTIVLSIVSTIWFVTYIVAEIVTNMGNFGGIERVAPYDALMSFIGGFLLFGIIIFALSIVILVLNIIILNGLSNSFGHGAGFTVGLVFLPIVFWAILAFGKSTHISRQSGGEPGPYEENPPVGEPGPNITCSMCGARFFYDESLVMPGQTFVCYCPNCGTRLQFMK